MADTGVEEDSGARFAVERSSGVLNFFYTACWLRPSHSFIPFFMFTSRRVKMHETECS